MSTDRKWSGRYAQRAREYVASLLPLACSKCGGLVEEDMTWDVDHVPPRSALTWEEQLDPSHWRAAHRSCNRRSGANLGNAMRRKGPPRLSVPGATPRRPNSQILSSNVKSVRTLPVTLSTSPREPGETDALPRFFSPPHPEAVASRGDEFVAHAEARLGKPLRWFQWLTAQRRYEVRADGSWCWKLVFESASRQEGKSITLAEDAAWVGSQATEAELILHAAYRVRTSLKVQSNLWHWAETQGFEVRRLLGDSHIIWPTGADWATVALDSAYGIPAARLLLDEAWAIDPTKFWNSMFPTLGDQENPQVLMWSTANPEARGLVADLQSDPSVCRMEWGILPDEDPMDPDVWRASSAYFGPGRMDLMAMASTRAGFKEEWLNQWPALLRREAERAMPGWDELAMAGPLPPRGGIVCLDERRDGDGFGMVVLVADSVYYREARELKELVPRANAAEHVIIGLTLDELAVKAGLRRQPLKYGSRETRQATQLLQNEVRSGRLRHDHDPEMSLQAAGARISESETGKMLSNKRSDAEVLGPKLLSWALYRERRIQEVRPVIW